MLSLPLVTPRDPHELWFGSYRSPSYINGGSINNNGNDTASRRQFQNNPGGHSRSHNAGQSQLQQYSTSTRALLSSATPSDSLALLQLEERALRLRKENIASFGCAWIKPAGCPKTMLGMREEEAEREEGLAAATQELNVAAMVAAAGGMTGDMDAFGDPSLQQQQQQMMVEGGGGDGDGIGPDELERDLDDDIPEADDEFGDLDDEEGLVEEGEEGYEEDEDADEGLMERDLDDDIPEGFADNDDVDAEEDDYNEEDDEHDYGNNGSMMVRDLDEDIPEAGDMEDEDMDEVRDEGEWQHTDSELEDNDDSDLDDDDARDPYAEHLRGGVVMANTQTPGSANPNTAASTRRHRQQLQRDSIHYLPPPSTSTRSTNGTEAQRRFLQRWSGGGTDSDLDVFDTSAITMDDEDEDLRASIMGRNRGHNQSQGGRPRQSQGRFGRFMRRGGPRDSLD